MTNFFKRAFIALTVFTMLFTAMPKKEAQAGIILAPAGIGIILLVIGIMHDDMLLIILDDAQNGQLESKLAHKYAKFSSNQTAFAGLAEMITARTNLVEVKDQNVEVKFTKEEVKAALGSAAANKALVNAVFNDLK